MSKIDSNYSDEPGAAPGTDLIERTTTSPAVYATPGTGLIEKPSSSPAIYRRKISSDCIIDGMPSEKYHGEPCITPSISSSGLRKIIHDCPAIYWYNSNLNPSRPAQATKSAFEIGKAAHDYLLLKDDFYLFNTVLNFDDYRTNVAKEARDKAKAEGKTVLLKKEFEPIKEMLESIKKHPFAMNAFKEGKPEQSIFWKDAETGVMCKCRPDFLPNDRRDVPDYKTAPSANPVEFKKSFFKFGYDQQAAWYAEGIEIVTGVRPENFFFVVQAKTPPYLVTCMTVDQEVINYGSMLNRKALRIFADCLEKDEWPGYSNQVESITSEDVPWWVDRMIAEIMT